MVLIANSRSGKLLMVPITLSSVARSIDIMAIGDTGSTLSLIDNDIRDQSVVQGNGITLNFAGIN